MRTRGERTVSDPVLIALAVLAAFVVAGAGLVLLGRRQRPRPNPFVRERDPARMPPARNAQPAATGSRSSRPSTPRDRPDHALARVSDPASAEAAIDPTAPLPPAISEMPWVRADTLPAERRDELLAGLRQIPRPPRILQQLVSPEFVNRATAAELEALILAEPVIAARLLQHLQAAAHGRQPTSGGVSHAVTQLGVNAVRVLCMRYALTTSFRVDEPERQQRLDRVWAASAMAGELVQQLGHRVGIENRAGVASAVVLSFLGRLAICVTLPLDRLRALPEPAREDGDAGFVRRVEAEHRALGIGASELGRLLMTDWGLPPAQIETACAIDAVVRDRTRIGDAPDAGRALGYVAARLGEALAAGVVAEPAAFDLATAGDDWFRVRQRLAAPPLSALPAALRAPQLGALLRVAGAAGPA